jgi:hypothetical protein
MLRKLIAVVAIVALSLTILSCRKKPAQSSPQKTEVRSQAEYNETAKKEIDANNMQAELDKIEKEMQQEKGRGF